MLRSVLIGWVWLLSFPVTIADTDSPSVTSLTPSLAPSLAPSSPSLAPSLAPSSAPSLLPMRFLPFQTLKYNSSAINVTFNLVAPFPTSNNDIQTFSRMLKGHIFQQMNWENYPYGPVIDIVDIQAFGNFANLDIVLEASHANALMLRLQNNASCVGYLCQLSGVVGSTSVLDCPDLGWSESCPTACANDECAHNLNKNNMCVITEDSYTCTCLSMAYRTGLNAKSCDPLEEISGAGVIAVAASGFAIAILMMLFIWWRYVVYHRVAPRKNAQPLSRPQRVNTIGRISPIVDGSTSRRLSATSASVSSTPDSSVRSSTPRALTRGASLAPGGRPSEKLSGAKSVRSLVPSAIKSELDPFKHKWNNKFQQMNFSGHKTTFSRLQAITVFIGAFCALFPSGLGLIIVTSDIVRQEMRYDNNDLCDLTKNIRGTVCLVKMIVEQDMAPPIHLHYRLDGFYQNHRSYVMSRDEKQLRFADTADNELRNCDPLNTGYGHSVPAIPPTFSGSNQSASNVTGPKMKLYPCGLVAQSWFNDVFGACHLVQNETFCDPLTGDNWDKTDIVYESDKTLKFVDRPARSNETKWNYFLGYQMPSLQDEDFISWMRVAPRDSFSKFYRNILNRNLKAGDTLLFVVQNNFPSETWEGKKSLVLSTASFFGGKTAALGHLYLTAAVISLIFAVILWLFGGPDAYYHGLVQNGLCKRPRRRSQGMRLD